MSPRLIIDPERARCAYREGGSIAAAAKALNVSASSVRRTLVEAGIPRARRGRKRNADLEARVTRAVELIACYAEAGRPLTIELVARWADVAPCILRESVRSRITRPRDRPRVRPRKRCSS